jgi:DNA-binding transcriptional MerR regulator
MPDYLQVFELPEMAEILGLGLARAKNWTNERTGLVIQPSIRTATGTGTRNLYSLEDLYVMGIAREFSKAGFAPKEIGKLLEIMKPVRKFRRDADISIWRLRAGGPFKTNQVQGQPASVCLWHTLAIGALLDSIDEAVAKFAKGLE